MEEHRATPRSLRRPPHSLLLTSLALAATTLAVLIGAFASTAKATARTGGAPRPAASSTTAWHDRAERPPI